MAKHGDRIINGRIGGTKDDECMWPIFWPSGGGNDKMSKHPPWDKDIFGASGLWDIFPADKMSGIEKHKVLSGSVGKVPEDWKKKWPIG